MNKLINNWLIGSDIEVFVKDTKNNEIVTAEPWIKGTKGEPFNFDISSPFFAISLDNVLAEFCIPPTNRKDEFLENIRKSRGYIDSILPERYCTVAQPAAMLRAKFLRSEKAQEFYCEPDINVWTLEENEVPKAVKSRLRSGGFHLHIGYDNPVRDTNIAIIKSLDLHVGIPSILQEPENERKRLYGKAGAFRKKDYGVEYRVPSNYLLQDESLTAWVFGATVKALDFVNSGRAEEIESVSELIQAAINGNNKVVAQNLINQFELELV